uniref:Uncharacterized protein n=1 Tax=Oryza nivara TaxID=4536 RepID=A0A0E0H949_ORYNI
MPQHARLAAFLPPTGRVIYQNQDVDRTLISCMQELAGEKGLSGDSLTFSALAIGTGLPPFRKDYI